MEYYDANVACNNYKSEGSRVVYYCTNTRIANCIAYELNVNLMIIPVCGVVGRITKNW